MWVRRLSGFNTSSMRRADSGTMTFGNVVLVTWLRQRNFGNDRPATCCLPGKSFDCLILGEYRTRRIRYCGGKAVLNSRSAACGAKKLRVSECQCFADTHDLARDRRVHRQKALG